MFGSKSKTEAERREEAEERKRNREAERSAQQTAAQEASQRSVTENANFLRELRRAGINTDRDGWIEAQLGPAVAEANVVGNRSEGYEQEVKWGTIAKGLQQIVERSPGRLCQDERDRRIARNLHKRKGDQKAKTPYTSAEKRKIQEAYETAVANYQSLSVEGRGGKMVGETTVTAKREVREERESAKEKAGGLIS